MSEWVNEWVSGWVTEWMSEWVNKWISECKNERKRGGNQGTPMRISDPVTVYIVPCLPRKRGEDQGTPGCTSDPLAMYIVPRLPRKRRCILPRPFDAKMAETKGRQSVYLSPWQYTWTHTYHTIEAETKEHQDVYLTPWQYTLSHAYYANETDTKAPQDVNPTSFAVHIVLRLPRKRNGDQGTPGIYPTLHNTHYPTSATQKKQRPKDARAFIQSLCNIS